MQVELLRKFFELKAQIEQVIPEDDAALLMKYDAQITEVWNEILSYQPRNNEERQILATFLVDQIQPDRFSASTLSRIKQKLIELL